MVGCTASWACSCDVSVQISCACEGTCAVTCCYLRHVFDSLREGNESGGKTLSDMGSALQRKVSLLYSVKSEFGFLSAPTSVKNRSEVAQTWLFVYLESSCSLTLNGKHQKPHADCSMELRLLTATVSPVRPVEAAQLMLQNTR